MKKPLYALAMVLAVVAVVAAQMAWAAWVLVLLWGWHIAPLFALPALPLTVAVGVIAMCGAVAASVGPAMPKGDKPSLAMRFVIPALMLAAGWIAHFL